MPNTISNFSSLLEELNYLNATEIEQVRRAYRFADQAHLGQMRQNGDPYITHPIAVASICAQWKLDANAICAALMHDVLEDCKHINKNDLIEQFNPTVFNLVNGLTKLEKLEATSREENQAESFRKMLLATSDDVRVILIKLADRTHNMRTMDDMPREKWQRISQETLDIYAPFAHRLGINQTYHELQDLAFAHTHPWRYSILNKALNIARNRSTRRTLIATVTAQTQQIFASIGMQIQISGREKSLFSIYQKMKKRKISFAKITDVYGIRIITPSRIDCYTAMGYLHQHYKPVPGKIKDYIAISKSNGYQSLHTTLVGPAGNHVEFQIRTHSMHLIAESGIAAHWLYKTGDTSANKDQIDSQWLKSLLDIHSQTHDATEFWNHVKIDLTPNSIYVFTPKNKIISLPTGATVIDFAYAVHSDIGNKTIAAKVNGEVVALRTELKNGDRIEVTTGSSAAPNPNWLSFVRTARARSSIRYYLKTAEQSYAIDFGQKLLLQALRAQGFEALPQYTVSYTTSTENHTKDVPSNALTLNTKTQTEIWDKLLHFTGNQTPQDLFYDLGLGKRISSIVASKLAKLLIQAGLQPSALLLSQTHFNSENLATQGVMILDGSENSTVRYSTCCNPIPGDEIVGYLGHGEGLVLHRQKCPTGQKLLQKDQERFIPVEWAENTVRTFETQILVTTRKGKGVLARVATTIAQLQANITNVKMPESEQDTADTYYTLSVDHLEHLDTVLRAIERDSSVLRAVRI